MNLAPIRKAVTAAVGAGVSAFVTGLGVALSDGRLTGTEVGAAVGLGLVAAGTVGRAVHAVTNRPA